VKNLVRRPPKLPAAEQTVGKITREAPMRFHSQSIRVATICLVAGACRVNAMDNYTMNGLDDDKLFAFVMPDEDAASVSVPWRDCVSKQVTAEGVAMGFRTKLGWPYVVLDGKRLFLKGKLLKQSECEGRLVRVKGKLKVSANEAVTEGAQPSGMGKRYYVDVEAMEVIGKARYLTIVLRTIKLDGP
jgi:hypothetical protein